MITARIAIDVIKKALDAHKHPGIDGSLSLPAMAMQGLPYLSSPEGRARPPKTIYWNVNSVCNLHCKMCDVGTFNEESNFYKNLRIDRKLKEIDPERFKSVVDEVASYGPMMAINGTEPLMYRPLGTVISYARSKNLDVSVTTGAYDLPRRAAELAEAGLTRLNVSIDGAPQLHNQIRGRRDVFERAAEGIVLFDQAVRRRGLKAQIYVNCTISNLNYPHLVDFYESVKSLPADQINFFNMSFVNEEMAATHNARWGGQYRATVNCLSDEVRPEKVDVDVLSEQIEAVRSRGGIRVAFLPHLNREELKRFYHEPTKFMGGTPCMSTWFIIQVMADGDLIPYTRCYHVVLGNINEQPFLEIWNGQKARAWRQDLRREGRFPACTRCDMVY